MAEAPLPGEVRDRGRLALLAPLFITAATFAAYWPSLRGGALWDDSAHLTSPRLAGLSGLRDIWLRLGATQQYYPVLHSAFWAEHRIWGGWLAGYHALNVLLHVAAACLFAWVLAAARPRGDGRPGVPEWFAAAVFALHPVCAESVAWISEQKNTLSLVFYLLSFLAYLRFDAGRRPGPYAAAAGFFVLALLSKSVTATLPGALLVAIAWRRGGIAWRRDVTPLLPLFAAALGFGIFSAWVERDLIGAHGAAFDLSLPQRLVLAGRVPWFYLEKLLWPSGLMFIYPRWSVTTAWPWPLGIAGLAAAAALLWAARRRSPAPFLAFLFFVGSLFPALGFVNVYPFRFSYVADHFQYLACLGVVALAADGGLRLAFHAARGRAGAAAIGAFCAALLALLFVLTRGQASLYRDAGTLYTATLERNPSAWMAENNLGVYLMDRQDYAGAAGHFRKAVLLRADYSDAHNNLGNALTKLPGRGDDALAEFREAIRLEPGMAQAHANLGHALAGVPGAEARAAAELRAALVGNADNPDYADAHADLGVVLAEDPRGLAAAVPEFEAALRLKPDSPDTLNNYGIALARAGRPSEAMGEFERALALRPGDASYHNNLGGVLSQLKRDTEAEAQYREAIRLRQDFAGAHFNLGRSLGREGRDSEAIAEHLEAERLEPRTPAVWSSLGSLYYRMGRYPDAIVQYEAAVGLNPASAPYRSNLGLALMAAGRTGDAIEQLRKAVEISPGFADAHYSLAVALRREGRAAEAEAEFEAAGRR